MDPAETLVVLLAGDQIEQRQLQPSHLVEVAGVDRVPEQVARRDRQRSPVTKRLGSRCQPTGEADLPDRA